MGLPLLSLNFKLQFMADEKQIFSLKQVVKSIQKTLSERYHAVYWIKAELHKINTFPSGHSFPELVYKEDGKIQAQMSGVIWKSVMTNIQRQFKAIAKEPLKEGSTVLLMAKIVFSETHGISLNILDIDPNYALGELQRERQETLKRLNKEGILNANQQVLLPLLPKRVAVISAAASKGLSDFYQVLERNDKGYFVFTHLFPAYLQGDIAPSSIIKQLKRIEAKKELFDLVVIVRGGGGEVGLTCYNNYELCKEIANFPLPIWTGIGHSTNLTVSEMIAHQNGITPTALAEMILRCFENFDAPLEEAIKYLKRNLPETLNGFHDQLNRLSEKFENKVMSSLSGSSHALEKAQINLLTLNRSYVLEKNQNLINVIGELKGHTEKVTWKHQSWA